MNTKPIALWAGVLLALSAAGCASLRPEEDIDVSLMGIRLEAATALETTAVFTIRVQNQRPLPLGLAGGVHKVYLNGDYIGSGVTDETMELGRLSEGTQTVRVHLRNLGMAQQIRDIIEQRRLAYRLDSVLYAGSDGRKGRLRVTGAGTLDLKEFQPTRPN